MPKPTEAPQEVTFSAKIGTEAQRWIQPRYYLKLASPCGESEQFPGPSSGLMAQPLIYDIDFSPRAHVPQEDGSLPGPDPVCPYTHVMLPIEGSSLELTWYGLALSYWLGADLYYLSVGISGGDVGNKNLPIRPRNLRNYDPESNTFGNTIKWEGYDDQIHEDSVLPVCLFPNSGQAYAPQHVVAEGIYQYSLEAESFEEPKGGVLLIQKHLIKGIPVYVEYDLAAVIK